MNFIKKLVSSWVHIFALLGKASPGLSLAVAIATALEAVSGIGVLYLVKQLIDATSQAMSSPQQDPSVRIMPLLVFTGALVVLSVLIQSIGSLLRLRQSQAISEYVDREIHNRAISVDLKFYESSRYYDALDRARQGGAQRSAQVVSNLVLMFRAAIVLAGVLLLLAGIDLLLIPILLVPVLIALSVRLYYTRRLFDWRMRLSQLERRSGYLDWMLTSAEHAKELRLNRLGEYLRDLYQTLKAQIRKGHIQIEQSRLLAEFAVAVVGAAVFIAASAWLLQQSLSQGRPIGDVALFVLLLRRAESGGSELVSNISRIVDDHLYLERLFEFLAITPGIGRPETPALIPSNLDEGVSLSNVSFRYDGAPEDALHEVSLQIRPGQIVALVGENGSGKTTLIKLLTRLYDPSAGTVTLNGADVRSFDPYEYRKLFSVIFQDFAMYAETAAENIRYGDISLGSDQSLIVEAARKAGAADFIERLPQSYQTPLSKLFDNGQDLSIGQWQRLALARAFYPRSRFVILDEPTSAVDPKAEYELFEKFKERMGGRGALVISHRLSTVRMADYTYVLERGRIIEHGVHDELIAIGGKYADLFAKQARNYR